MTCCEVKAKPIPRLRRTDRKVDQVFRRISLCDPVRRCDTTMNTSQKSSIEEIRDRFDRDVDRFSNLETGQTATVDAALALDLIARSAATATPAARAMLDIGCGGGNFTLKVLERLPNLDCTLIDLSANMLARATARVTPATTGLITAIQNDVRLVEI